MDTMIYKVAPTESFGWMSEAHRLSLGANRFKKGTTAASNANRLHQIVLARCQHVKTARASILQPVVRWLSTLKISNGVHRSTM